MAAYSLDSEYLALKAVMLCKPSRKIESVHDPREVLYTEEIDSEILDKEYGKIIELYKKLKVKLCFIDSSRIKNTDCRYVFNLMFTRDLFFMTPSGAILSRMASGVRQDEIFYAKRALKENGVRIRKIIQGNATFEGADALWVTPRMVAVGVGNRTNEDGFRQIEEELKRDGIECVCLPVPKGTLHLLGALQFIDKNLVLVRTGLVSPMIISFLEKAGIRIIEVPENGEVKEKQALNFVTLAPKKIIMPACCPLTKKIFKRHGIEVVAEVCITQLINGGGGFACTAGILSRGR